MKNILRGAVAAVALVGIATSASAQTSQVHYAGLPIVGTLTNPGVAGTIGAEISLGLGIGTRYSAFAGSLAGDSVPAVTSITTEFTLTGKVNRDCSFYAGNDASAQTLDFGVIGVRTGNNENVGSAFTMRAPAVATVRTLTAGCNTNNEVVVEKDSALGLRNLNAGGYDTDEFQANIPYTVKAAWTGVNKNAVTGGTAKSVTVGDNALTDKLEQGAWRSDMNITFTTQTVQNKGLVAGDYQGKTKVILRAI